MSPQSRLALPLEPTRRPGRDQLRAIALFEEARREMAAAGAELEAARRRLDVSIRTHQLASEALAIAVGHRGVIEHAGRIYRAMAGFGLTVEDLEPADLEVYAHFGQRFAGETL